MRSPVARRSPSSTPGYVAAQAELDDVAQELRVASELVADDPERLEELRRRRQQLRELCRKYGDTLADVMAFTRQAAARLAEVKATSTRPRWRARSRGWPRKRPRLPARCRRRAPRRRRSSRRPVEKHLPVLAMPAAMVTVADACASLLWPYGLGVVPSRNLRTLGSDVSAPGPRPGSRYTFSGGRDRRPSSP